MKAKAESTAFSGTATERSTARTEAPAPRVLPAITLPADIYDTLELSSLAFGGIGGEAWSDPSDGYSTPFCIGGHLEYSGVAEANLFSVVCAAFPSEMVTTNNCAIRRINGRKHSANPVGRVTFDEYVAELNIVRGD